MRLPQSGQRWRGGRWPVGRFAVVECGRRPAGCGHGEELTAEGELGGAMAVGEVTVMTDAVETVGQDMEEEAGG